ncbi:MAG TPA: V4R domain-containing protein, partial [Candidatus Thermoplasmatota archaeon]|nr:V4R domain-containing protein [Candidatus Thermoplasmatota archaeon]
PTPRVMLPPASPPVATRHVPRRGFEAGRQAGREGGRGIDRGFQVLREHGVEARILQSNAHWKIVRLYACATCGATKAKRGCEFERGLLAGAFEGMTNELAKVHEVACMAQGAPHCEFEVRHAPLPEVL